MKKFGCNVSQVAVWLAVVALASAQITFSRDWTGGKRSPHDGLDCSQFATLCKHFVHELKQALAPEIKHHHAPKPKDEDDIFYDDDK